MKKTSTNSVPCACFGRRLARKRIRQFCSRPCTEVGKQAAKRAARLKAKGGTP